VGGAGFSWGKKEVGGNPQPRQEDITKAVLRGQEKKKNMWGGSGGATPHFLIECGKKIDRGRVKDKVGKRQFPVQVPNLANKKKS